MFVDAVQIAAFQWCEGLWHRDLCKGHSNLGEMCVHEIKDPINDLDGDFNLSTVAVSVVTTNVEDDVYGHDVEFCFLHYDPLEVGHSHTREA